MNGKPVHQVPAKSILNLDSGFRHKLLCDGPTFSAGSACAYSCSFCYVPDLMQKSPHMTGIEQPLEDIVIRRQGALEALIKQLYCRDGSKRFADPQDNRVIYASPLVDVAANMELVNETISLCAAILTATHWQIRLLSKSNLLPKIAQGLIYHTNPVTGSTARERVIYGVSTGTLDDGIARAIEAGTPLVSKRIESLHWLQDHGYRTFGMICPSLPQRDYLQFAGQMAAAIRADRCEHVWAEVINLRGESFRRTLSALASSQHLDECTALRTVADDRDAWEQYARATFQAHAAVYSRQRGKLRFLQYVTAHSRPWWEAQKENGAILL
jgi:DNA repair photolyase